MELVEETMSYSTKPVNQWTPQDVQTWILDKGFKNFVNEFSYTTGAVLVSMDFEDLIKMNIPGQAAVPLSKFILTLKDLKRSCDFEEEQKITKPRNYQILMQSEQWSQYLADTQSKFLVMPVDTYSDYEKIRLNCAYFKDITGVLVLLKSSQKEAYVLMRPPRFGKTLLLSILKEFYDINNSPAKFQFLFEGTKASHLEDHSNCEILMFNFALMNRSSAKEIKNSFKVIVLRSVGAFFDHYKHKLPGYIINADSDPLLILSTLFAFATKSKLKICVLIDEYDSPLNYFTDKDKQDDGGRLKTLELLKGFYALLKENVSACISLIFMVGVLPMALADLSSAFNIYTDLTFDPAYSHVLGLTDKDLIKPMERLDNDEKRQRYLKELKNRFNGFHFVPGLGEKAEGLYCTNLVVAAVADIFKKDELSAIYSNSEPNQQVISCLVQSPPAVHLLEELILNKETLANKIQLPHTYFKWNMLYGKDPIAQIKAILFHMGVLTFYAETNKADKVHLTNETSRTVVQRALYQLSDNPDTRINAYFNEGNIGPILQFMESQGLYKSEKSETFSEQNELSPQAAFVALLNWNEEATKLEEPLYKTEDGKVQFWVDALTHRRNIINITKWKNVQLDYLEVPDAKISLILPNKIV